MGILDALLGQTNPLAQFADNNRSALGAIGAGLASGPTFSQGLANAAQLMPQARQADQQYNLQQQNKNQTIQFLQTKFPDLARAVSAGLDPATAYGLALKQDMADRERQRQLGIAQNFAKGISTQYPDIAAAVTSGAITPADAFKAMQTGQKPPTVTDIYDPTTGQPYKAQWDAKTGTWDQLGGVKVPASGAGSAEDDAAAKEIAGAIISGNQPPSMTGLYKYSGPVRAELAKQGYDLTKASQDWTATSRLLSTMNGPQQIRLRQATQQVADQVKNVRSLADAWNAGGFKPLNSVTRKAAEQGLLGPQAQSIVTKLNAAVADMTAELGTVYMGGNSPTDHAMELASKNLDTDWSDSTLQDNLDQIDKNLSIRLNSLNLSTGGVPTSQYNQMTPNVAAPSQSLPSSTGNAPSLSDYKSRYGLD
jgi:hypothetical protein